MLFSKQVVFLEGIIDEFQGELSTLEREVVQFAVEKRQREFTAGRICAKRALAVLGVECSSLLAGSKREPLWPHAIRGSIAHTDTHVAVAVGKASTVKSIGLDVELRDRLKPSLWPLVFMEAERTALKAIISEDRRNLTATLMFSAKECFYKYQFPLTQKWVGFQDASVQLMQGDQFKIKLHQDISTDFRAKDEFIGRYQVFEDRVMTALEF